MATCLANHIDGRRSPPSSNEYVANVNPANGDALPSVPRSTTQDVDSAVLAAHTAFAGTGGEWSKTTVDERADLAFRIADAIEARTEEFAKAESADTGKPLSLATNVDVARAVSNFRFFAGAAKHSFEKMHPMPSAINYTTRRPVGVCALITPWNLPLYLLTWKVAPALVMGNTMVAKPSEVTPQTASLLAEVMSDVGCPDGVFNVVHGVGADIGDALVSHELVSAVSFTGGTATGSHVAATAAPSFKKLSLELGGKNPTVVFADCDFERTVEGVLRASFLNSGQICLCSERLFVEESIHDRFVEALVAKARDMRIGDPNDPKVNMGPLVSLEHREKVERYLDLAREEGAEVICGGKRPSLPEPFAGGAFLEPTIVKGLSPDCRTSTEEIFGPVVSVHPFRDGDDRAVVEYANNTRYGLAASVWTQDLDRAHQVASAIDTGMVWVNTWLMRDLRVPFGGTKESGVGREGGQYSMEFFSESKNVCIALNDKF